MKKKCADAVLLAVFSFLIALGSVGLLFFPAPRFSASENRYLADFPDFSLRAFASGQFGTALDLYCTERLPGREILRGIRADSELLLMKHEVNRVIVCSDGSLSKRPSSVENLTRRNVRALSDFLIAGESRGIPCTVAVAPRRIHARREVLPSMFQEEDFPTEYDILRGMTQNTLFFDDLTQDSDWYRTDHHWTTLGAYRAYVSLCPALGIQPLPLSHFTQVTVSHDFLGTSAAAAGIRWITPDSIELFRYTGDTDFRIITDGTPLAGDGFYRTEYLAERDRYAIYFGGNPGSTEIDMGENDGRPFLVLYKDSFANSLLPFLAPHFRILALDPRLPSSADEKRWQDADRILVLCGIQTLTETAFSCFPK